MKLKLPRSSTTETVTTRNISQAASTPATIAALVVAHASMRGDMPFSLLIAGVILSIVVPKCRRVVHATLCVLFGLVSLPASLLDAQFNTTFGDHLSRQLAKITSLLNGTPLADWASAPVAARVRVRVASAPAPTPASATVPALAPIPAYADPAKQQAFLTASAPSPDFSPPKFEEPVYDGALTGMAERRPTGATDALDTDIQPRGRHAKGESGGAAEVATELNQGLGYLRLGPAQLADAVVDRG